jgi:hypothetical protein
MKIARLIGLMLVAVFAMSLVAGASSASALENPLFTTTGNSITGTSGTAVLTANSGTERVTCEKSSSTGTITSSLLAGNILVHFLNCIESGSKGTNCTAKSVGAAEGLIITTTLHGILGIVLPSGATGLLLLPVSGKRFVTLAATACALESTVTGSVAGTVTPTGKKATTGKLTLAVSSGKQAITSIDLTHGLGNVEPALTAFSTTATEEIAAELKFSPETEVT